MKTLEQRRAWLKDTAIDHLESGRYSEEGAEELIEEEARIDNLSAAEVEAEYRKAGGPGAEAPSALTPAEALAIVARLTFRPFTESDWMAFSGCESERPLIGESGDDEAAEWLAVIDGAAVEVLDADGELRFSGALIAC